MKFASEYSLGDVVKCSTNYDEVFYGVITEVSFSVVSNNPDECCTMYTIDTGAVGRNDRSDRFIKATINHSEQYYRVVECIGHDNAIYNCV